MNTKKEEQYTEVSRKSRVKLHKSGKHWVRTVMSQIGFIQLGKRSATAHPKMRISTVSQQESAAKVLRGLIAASAIIGGGVSAEQILAEENVVVTTEVTGTILANDDTVSMSNVAKESELSSYSLSESESISIMESISNSEFFSQSESISLSASLSESVSVSVSESTSESVSESLSESVSESEVFVTSETNERIVSDGEGENEEKISSADSVVERESEVSKLRTKVTDFKRTLNVAESLQLDDLATAYALLFQAQGVLDLPEISIDELNMMQSIVAVTENDIQKRI